MSAIILAIDTSCDDTAAAVTCGYEIWSNIISSQAELHRPYGGVFPTVAKLAHSQNIATTVATALSRAGVTWEQIDAIAVTQGPGLAPALEVGIAHAQELAKLYNLPLIPVNHIEGHLLSPLARPRPRDRRTTATTQKTGAARTASKHIAHDFSHTTFPVLGLVVSGGHTQFVKVSAFGEYEVLGQTLDDAAGECLDKIGRMLNLGYPAAPVIEEFAKLGDPHAIAFPLPMTMQKNYDLSFSGLKTFARNLLEVRSGAASLSSQEIYDFCASAQFAVFRHISYKLEKVIRDERIWGSEQLGSGENPPSERTVSGNNSESERAVPKAVWLGGGVASNRTLRRHLRTTLRPYNILVKTPYTNRLCMDNAAMIGVAAQCQPHTTSQTNLSRQPRLSL